jgi:hypothetical protein
LRSHAQHLTASLTRLTASFKSHAGPGAAAVDPVNAVRSAHLPAL